MRWYRSILIAALHLVITHAGAQTYVGLSLNVGNREQYFPSSYGFEKGLAPSGSIFVTDRIVIKDRWIFQYGATAGVAAYSVRPLNIDTLNTSNELIASPFPEYSTVFLSGDVVIGQRFLVAKKYLMFGAGIGATLYASFVPTSNYYVSIGDPSTNSIFTVFEASMNSPTNVFSPFWKVASSYDINKSFCVGLEYVYHLNAFADGVYEFYHTATPRAGNIKVYQREFRLAFSYKLPNKRNSWTSE